MVARGAGAAGPVLLACHQRDPLGLARRLPSLEVGAWRSAPLLPWRVQCPVRVCAALAAGSGGSGRYLVLCLSRFPHPAPRVPRCVWRAVPSGCPLPSLAGTPFHAVCAFRVLGPVAFLVVPACPLRVFALALPRRPLPPPLGGVACAPRAVPALGAGRAVPRGPCPSACPAPVACSVWHAWGGTVRSRFPPTWLLLRGASEVRRSPSPDCPLTGRAVWGPLPTCCGRGCVGVGAQHCPLGLHALWGLRAAGVVWWKGVPGGGWPATVVRGVWCQALSLPRPPVLWAGCQGPLPTGCGCGGGAGVGTHHQPHRARSCELALRAVGAARGRPGGGASCLGVGRLVSGAVPPPSARPLGGLPGPTTDWLWVRGGAGMGTRHQPHSARSCVLWGRHEGARGGASCLGVGRPGSGALPAPTARPLGGLPGPTTHGLWVRGGAGVGTRHRPHSARSCQLALRAVGAARGRPGGAPLAWVWGARGRALSHPRLPALRAGCRGPLATGCGYGGVRAWGPVTNPTARALASWLCALWERHGGARGGRLLPG